MAIEITSDTVVKILVRRGTNSERKLTALTEGEIGYTIDTQRMFVGDGVTPGGHAAGIKFLGVAASNAPYSSQAELGDLIYVTDGSGNTTSQVLYAYTGEGAEPWYNIHPRPYTAPDNNITSLEKAPDGKWRVAGEVVMGNTPEAPTGFSLVYEDETSKTLNSLTKIYNRLDFDSRFLSLSVFNATNPGTIYPSFYFGDVNKRNVANNWSATVNVDKNIFINSQSSTSQIQIYANDPNSPGSPSIKCYGEEFIITGHDSIFLNTRIPSTPSSEKWGIYLDGTTKDRSVVTTLSAISAGSYVDPDHIFMGASRFKGPVYTDPNADLTVYGNLSVFGDITYLDTVVSTTSSLSVISYNTLYDTPAFMVGQFNSLAPYGQTIARFVEGGYNTPLLSIKESQSVCFFGPSDAYYLNNGSFNFVVSGDALFQPHNFLGAGRFYVDMTTRPRLGANDDVRLWGHLVNIKSDNSDPAFNNRITLDTNDDLDNPSRYVKIVGGLNVTSDIIAFAASDVRLKDNKKNISNALDIVNKLNGITFDWNDKSQRTGKDYGVIAQEVEEVLPELVQTRDNGYKAVRYEKLIPVLIEAIKQLKRELDEKK